MIGRTLLLGAALTIGGILVSCGGDGDSGETGLPSTNSVQTATQAATTPTTPVAPAGTPRPESTGGTAGGPEPILQPPAAYYNLLDDDVTDGDFQPSPPETYIVNSARFALLGQFQSGMVAATAIQEWGYVEGWNVQFDPIGQLAAVATGAYYITGSTYLFESVEGAGSAYDSFLAQYRRVTGSEEVEAAPLGNESAAFSIESGTIGRTNLPNVYHRFLFRRGNMVAVVQVNGAGPYVSMDIARDYAVMMDDKALGKRPADLPTPIPTVQVAVPTQ